MAYFSKEAELLAFRQLSEISPDPTVQGATQKVSAIRYAIALDEFYKHFGRNCDSGDREDSRAFEVYVGNVVSLYEGVYTQNFYSFKKHDGDFCVRSNFYSAGAVNNSKINNGIDVDYPRRSWPVVLVANKGHIIWRADLISNIKDYLPKDAYKVALVVWLLRGCNTINEADLYASVKTALLQRYTQTLVDAILPAEAKFMSIYSLHYPANLSTTVAVFEHKDFEYGTELAPTITIPETVEEVEDTEDPDVDNTYTKVDFINDAFLDSKEYDEIVELLKRKKNVVLQGAPGVGKTYIAKKLAYSIIGKCDDSKVELVQFHQSYSYEDFVVGYKPTENGFKIETGPFYDFCKRAKTGKGDYFFIIDEINRGNLSRIFGELLMLVEDSKRGDSATLLYTKEPFSVPNNVYIIGLMNTADRSLAMIDYALRRRFSFYTMDAAFNKKPFERQIKLINNDNIDALISVITDLNKAIENDPNLGKGFKIGHSYFCVKNASNDTLRAIIKYEIVPLLEEYWYDEPSNVEKWSKHLFSVISE